MSGFYGLIVLLFVSCNANELIFDDIKIPNLQGDFTLVVGETTYTISELLADLDDPNIDISEDAAGVIGVYYRDTTAFDDYTALIDIDDVTNDGSVSPGISLPGSPADLDSAIQTIDLSFTYDSPNNEQLDSVIYSAGNITLDILSTFDVEADFELTIHDITQVTSGTALVFTGTLPASSTSTVSETLTLVDHKTVMTRVGSVNNFSGAFDATLKIKTGDIISAEQKIDYTITISDAEFSKIFGWFGNQTIELQDQTIEIDFFEGIEEFGLVFGNPQVNFFIANSFGVPMGMLLDGISASNADGKTETLTGTVTESPQTVRAPTISNVGSSVESTVSITKENSNLQDLLAISPNVFNLTVSASSNYLNPADPVDPDFDTLRNFVTDASAVEVVTEIGLPLDVQLANFSRDFGTDIESFDFKDADTLSIILKSVNDLPFDGIIDMQFLDADSVVLFQYSDVLLLESPIVDGTGRTVEPSTNTATIKVYIGNGYQELLDASTLNLVMKINSYEADEDRFVKIYADYQTVLKVSFRGKLNLEL